ncbi:hypothetical protein [uncultured Tateyamaria sp.]|uniref:hypothetical protein n=1 Tax=uncultured Tateyamaria sp. TaxID=455651 RepID=UPI00262F1559|nr:hypothetical protein [uncultured Tateyamaria sp.]
MIDAMPEKDLHEMTAAELRAFQIKAFHMEPPAMSEPMEVHERYYVACVLITGTRAGKAGYDLHDFVKQCIESTQHKQIGIERMLAYLGPRPTSDWKVEAPTAFPDLPPGFSVL